MDARSSAVSAAAATIPYVSGPWHLAGLALFLLAVVALYRRRDP